MHTSLLCVIEQIFGAPQITFKAKQMHDEKCTDESEKDSLVASRGFVENIMKRFGLSLRGVYRKKAIYFFNFELFICYEILYDL